MPEDIQVKYDKLIEELIKDHRTLLISERVHFHFGWNSVHSSITRIEIQVRNCVELLIGLKPDLLLFQATPHNLPSWLLAKTAEFFEIPVFFIQTTPLPWRFWLVSGMDVQKPIYPFQGSVRITDSCQKRKSNFIDTIS